VCRSDQLLLHPQIAHLGYPPDGRSTLDDLDGSTDQSDDSRLFDPQKLVAEVNKCFTGFHFTIQAVPPTRNWAERVKQWQADKAAAEQRGLPFDQPAPSMGTLGSATFEHCTGEWRDSGFILEVSMKSQSGRPFVIFIEEDDMIPEMGDWDRPNVEGSIAAQLAFWTDEMICHGTTEELDGRAVGSRKWIKTWT